MSDLPPEIDARLKKLATWWVFDDLLREIRDLMKRAYEMGVEAGVAEERARRP